MGRKLGGSPLYQIFNHLSRFFCKYFLTFHSLICIILFSSKENIQNEAIAKLIKEFKALSISEREKLIDFVSANSSPSDFKFIVDTKLADGIVCPHCGAKGKGVCWRPAAIPAP